METPVLNAQRISSSTQIRHRIMHLSALKEEQEEILKRDMQEIKYALTPASIFRNTLKGLNQDDSIRQDTVKQTLSMGAGLLIDTLVFRKGFGIKKYLLDTGLKKLVNHFIARKKA